MSTSRRGAYWHRGGATKYGRIQKDIQDWINQEKNSPDVYFSTMFDLYALPVDFPELETAKKQADPYARVTQLEQAFSDSVNSKKFIPYIQLHEFEALLFADIRVLDDLFPEQQNGIVTLEKLTAQFNSPEQIDDGRDTAPSKRIIQAIPDYKGRKVESAARVGIHKSKEKCPHFAQWINQLENLR